MTTRRFICLANSRKLNGRCVAGVVHRAANDWEWIRPVSGSEHGEVSEADRRFRDGTEPKLLDIVEAEFKNPLPEGHQPENWLIDDEYYWIRQGQFPVGELTPFLAAPGHLWHNGDSTYHGVNDRLTSDQAEEAGDSLRLILVENLRVKTFQPGAAFGNAKRRVQGHFAWAEINYRLWVTDPTIEQRSLALPDGEHDLGPCYLTISVGEPMDDGSCYKLVAGVIEVHG